MFSLRLMYYYQLHNCPLVAASISTTARGEKGEKDEKSHGDKYEREKGEERRMNGEKKGNEKPKIFCQK